MMNVFYAFCAGAFGAMLGGSAAFALTGVFCAISMAALCGGADAAFLHTAVAFGPMMLPAVSYAAGATSAHYARWRGYVPYGEGRNTDRALWTLGHPDIMIFGGCIGALGWICNSLMGRIGLGAIMDTSAAYIWFITLTLKILLDHEVFSKPDAESARLGRYHRRAKAWQPMMTRPFDMVLYAGVIAGLAACCTSEIVASENALMRQYGVFLPFAVSSVVLVLGQGKTQVPTTHHITICASYAVAAGGNVAWGVLSGVLVHIVGDFLGRTFTVHGDVMICPAAMSIVVVSLLTMGLLPAVSAYSLTSFPWLLLAAAVVVSAWMQHRGSKATVADTNLSA
ncbi:MAG: hypothetical protein IJA83_03660 [Clostridia bacterium]|nr:hypothetical protein [Clostridia bacterium]